MPGALGEPFFQRVLLAGLLASVACGVLGSFVVARRITSLAGGLAHAAFGGVGLGYWLGFPPMLGAACFGVLGGIGIGVAERRLASGLDTLVSMLWATGMALGIVFVALAPGYAPDLMSYLFGSLLLVSWDYVALVAALDALILVLVLWLFPRLQAVCFDEEFAEVAGLPVERLRVLLLALTGLAVVTLIRVVGVILVIALLTVPAATARHWTRTLPRMMGLASALAALCTSGGLLLSWTLSEAAGVSAPPGPLIVLLATAVFAVSAALEALTRQARARRAALALLALGPLACSEPAADNLLLVSFDTTRPDRLATYGYARPTSPSLDALARRGTLFENAYSHVPSTLPAHASILTGRLPPSHGVRCNGKFRLPEAAVTLAEVLRDAGFATGAVLGAVPLEAGFGLEQGFDHYDDDFRAPWITQQIRKQKGWKRLHYERSADDVSTLAIEWLEGREPRWFLFAHYFDPHWPYEPKPDFPVQLEDPYDLEVAYADHHLGRLLEAARRAPGRTLVVFTADHGENLGDHNLEFHGRTVFDTELRVPLVVALEGVTRPGQRVAARVSQVDLMPTALELLGVAAPPGLEGRSLAPALAGGELEPRPVYAESLVYWVEIEAGLQLRSWIDGRYKWIESLADTEPRIRYQLYDLEADPGETRNLADSEPELAERLRRTLREASQQLERAGHPPEPIEPNAELVRQLQALGYLGGPDAPLEGEEALR